MTEEQVREKTLRVLATGFDWLAFTSPLDASPSLLKRLVEAKRRTQDGEQVTLDLGHARYTMTEHGAAGGYEFVLASEDAGNLLVSKDPGQGCKVELGSLPLWRRSVRGAYQQARAALSELFEVGDKFPARPTRIDFCVDFQGVTPSSAWIAEMVTRARSAGEDSGPNPICLACKALMSGDAIYCHRCGHKRGAALDGEQLSPDGHVDILAKRKFWRGGQFTGWEWGRGKPLYARVYNKTVEIRDNSPDKSVWVPEVWAQLAGDLYDPDEQVWRVELECKRDFLRRFSVDGWQVETVEHWLEIAPDAWRYLVGYPRKVCSYCNAEPIPRSNGSIPARCPTCYAGDARPDPASPRARARAGARDGVGLRRGFWRSDVVTRRQLSIPDELELAQRNELGGWAGDPFPPLPGARCEFTIVEDMLGSRVVPGPELPAEVVPGAWGGGRLRRPRGWLELRMPRDGVDKTRWKLHPLWVKLQEARFLVDNPSVYQTLRLRDSARRDIAVAMAVGCSSTYASVTDVRRQLERRLKRTPLPEEVWRETCVQMALEIPPEKFLRSVLRKDQRRGRGTFKEEIARLDWELAEAKERRRIEFEREELRQRQGMQAVRELAHYDPFRWTHYLARAVRERLAEGPRRYHLRSPKWKARATQDEAKGTDT